MCHQGKRTALGLQLLYSHAPSQPWLVPGGSCVCAEKEKVRLHTRSHKEHNGAGASWSLHPLHRVVREKLRTPETGSWHLTACGEEAAPHGAGQDPGETVPSTQVKLCQNLASSQPIQSSPSPSLSPCCSLPLTPLSKIPSWLPQT